MKVMKPIANAPVMLKNDFDRFFDRFFTNPLVPDFAPTARETMWTPAVDFSENEKEYIVRLEVPGIHKEDLEVKLESNLLTLAGRREFRKELAVEEYLWAEREEGRFNRTIRLPMPVEETKVDANYNDGILTVRLAKVEPKVKSRILIK